MALINRVTRLFRADLHAVLDRVEEPDILLRQAIREMEEDLALDEQACRRHEREYEQLTKKESEFRQLHASLGEELDVCFAADKEDLARSLIRRRLETEGSLQLLERRRETLAAQRDQLAQRLAENRTRYESMCQKAELFDERRDESVPDSVDRWPSVDVRVRDEDVEVALLKERQRRAGR
ncbi:MAG: PspA/IM30 family protein [Sedimenticolaceae bacterium]